MRLYFSSFGALAGAIALAACGSSGSTASGPGADGGNGSSSSGGGSGSGSGSGGGSGSGSSSGGGSSADASATDGDVTMADSGGGTQSYTVKFGPIQVKPQVENTQCIVVRLGNAAAIHVGQIHDQLGTASHHMILYKVSDTVEQRTPFNCTPFQDTLNTATGSPLIISQKIDDTLTLPPGVAFSLDANQMVRLEMHYINANPTQTVTLETTSTLTTIADAAYKYDGAFLFIGDPVISIPPMATFSTGPQFFQPPAQYAASNFFAITGHEHSLGTKVQIWSAASASDPGTSIYTSTSWSDPPTTTFSPAIQLPAGGGFKFQCDWNNTTTNTVKFGEYASDEMCFFWAYYWPSQGAQVCAATGGLSACCPGPSPLCTALGL